MMPTIGRIIHVYEPLNDQCVAGIVTAVDYGARVPVPTVYATILPPHGPANEVARRVTLPDQGSWHDPRDCHPRPLPAPQGDHYAYPSALGTDTAGDETSPPLGDPGQGGGA